MKEVVLHDRMSIEEVILHDDGLKYKQQKETASADDNNRMIKIFLRLKLLPGS